MKFTRAEDYTLFLLGKIAEKYGKNAVPLSEISKNTGISVFYLKQLVRPLVKRKLLLSKEGSGGGYTLSRKPSSVSLFDIFTSLNTLPTLNPCLYRESCSLIDICKNSLIWKKINKKLSSELKKIKLSELL